MQPIQRPIKKEQQYQHAQSQSTDILHSPTTKKTQTHASAETSVAMDEIDSILNYGDTGKDLSHISPQNSESIAANEQSISAMPSMSSFSQSQGKLDSNVSKRSPSFVPTSNTELDSIIAGLNQQKISSSPLQSIQKTHSSQHSQQIDEFDKFERNEETGMGFQSNYTDQPENFDEIDEYNPYAPSQFDPYSASFVPGQGQSFNSNRVNIANTMFKKKARYEKKTNLEMSIDPVLDLESEEKLGGLLKKYILKKCSINEHCRKQDFDGTALDGLNRLFFIQSLQAVEHYAASVSERIQKKPAYLMGILRGQESHWDNSRAAAQLEGGSVQLLNLPGRILYQIGLNCLEGNCLPSDFTPEVLLSLHSLTVKFALKALNAFNSNKRIAAGVRGGVVNRPRFFQRLIENVIQQNPVVYDPSQGSTVEEPPGFSSQSFAPELTLSPKHFDNFTDPAISSVIDTSKTPSSEAVHVKFSPTPEIIETQSQIAPPSKPLAAGMVGLKSASYHYEREPKSMAEDSENLDESEFIDTASKLQTHKSQVSEPIPTVSNLASISPKSPQSFYSLLEPNKTSPDSTLGVIKMKSNEERETNIEMEVIRLQDELKASQQREMGLVNEKNELKQRLDYVQAEYVKLKNAMNELIGGVAQKMGTQYPRSTGL